MKNKNLKYIVCKECNHKIENSKTNLILTKQLGCADCGSKNTGLTNDPS